MANTLTELIPLMTVNVLDHARANAVTPRLVTSNYGAEVAEKGQVIKLNVMNDFSTSAVTPGVTTPAANNDINPSVTSLSLNQWFKSSFVLTNKDLKEIVETGKMKALESATAAVVDKIDTSVLGLYSNVYNAVGTAGTTPFASSTSVLASANVKLSQAKAPKMDRSLIVDPLAYGNATQLNIFQAANASGSTETLTEASITRRIGYDWGENQNVLTHTTTAAGDYAIDASASAGATSITIDDAAGALPTAMVVGDVFTIAGSTQQYVVTSYTAGSTDAVVGISPALDQNVTDGVLITEVASHVVNLAFQREAFHLAVRPTDQVLMSNAERVYMRQNVTDTISGLTLTLMVFEQYHQTMAEVSALWGVACPRPDFACRVMG